MSNQTIEWTAEQICGECGEGAFYGARDVRSGREIDALCDNCGHEHPMDPCNLGEGERFEWLGYGPTLHVTSYSITDGE